jgi:hypothetical protein
MTNYSVTCKILRGSQGTVESLVSNYINSLDSLKVLRSVSVAKYGSDNVLVLIVHDA